MTKLILCTVGTSVFDPDKYRKKRNELSPEFMNLCEKISSSTEVTPDEIVEKCNEQLIEGVIRLISERIPDDLTNKWFRASDYPAEIASLLKMTMLKVDDGWPKYGPFQAGDRIILLFSDTPEGGLAALVNGAIIAKRLLKETLLFKLNSESLQAICTPFQESPQPKAELKPDEWTYHISEGVKAVRIVGLRIEDNQTVKPALENLTETIRAYSAKQGYDHRLFNFTAGYKGIVPFSVIVALREGFTAFFLHENGKEVVYFEPIKGFKLDYDQLYELFEAMIVGGWSGEVVKQKRLANLNRQDVPC